MPIPFGVAIVATFLWEVATHPVTLVLVSVARSAFRKPPRLAVEGRDLGQNLSDPVAGLSVIYGTVRVGGHRVFMKTTDDGRVLWLVFALGHGPVAGIDEVWLDGHQAFTADGRARDAGGDFPDFTPKAAVWKAYGADGQFQITPLDQTSRTITVYEVVTNDSHKVTLTTSVAHGFQIGEILQVASCPHVPDGEYNVVAVPSTTKVTLYLPDGRTQFAVGGGVSSSGTLKRFTPNLSTELPDLTSAWQGRGIAFLVLRLLFDPAVFPGGVPRIEATVRGRAVEDPRTPVVRTISSVAVGPAVAHYTSTADVTTTAAHGLAVGDIVRIAGSGVARLDGDQRVDAVIDADTFRCYVPITGTGAAGTVTKLVHSENPALIIRDYLLSKRYGAAADADEIDEAAFQAEADYSDETVSASLPNTVSFTNERRIAQIAVSAGTATVTTETAHGYSPGQTVRIANMAEEGLNGEFSIVATPSGLTFTYATAVGDGTYLGRTFTVRNVDGSVSSLQRAYASVIAQQARLALSGVIDPTQHVLAVLDDLVQSCRGALAYQGGQFRLHIPKPQSAVMSLDERDFIGELRITMPGADAVANIVRATFFNPAQGYGADAVEYPPPEKPNQFWEDDNYRVLRQSIDLPYVTNRTRAQQIAMVARRESRQGITVSAQVRERCLALQHGDVIAVSHAKPGWSGKLFRVERVGITMGEPVTLVCREYDATAYDLEADDDTPFTPDNVRAVPVAFVAPEVDAVPSESEATGTLTLTITDPQKRVTRVEFATATGNNPLSAYAEDTEAPYQATVPLTDKQGSRIAWRVWFLDASGIEKSIGATVPFSGDQTAQAATISLGTPIGYSDRVEFPFTLGQATRTVEVRYKEFTSDPGAEVSVEFDGATPFGNPIRAGDGRTVFSIPKSGSNTWILATFVPYDALSSAGTPQSKKGQIASPTLPPDITTTPTEHAPGTTQTETQVDVTMPSDVSNVAAIRVYRDGVQYGSDVTRTAGASTAQRLTHTGLSAGATHVWKYKCVTAGGVVSSNFSPTVTITQDPGTLDAPTDLVAERDPSDNRRVICSWSPGANNPAGTTYKVREGTSTGGPYGTVKATTTGFSAQFFTSTSLRYYVVTAELSGWTSSGNSNESSA